ncbi:MAG: hypothetical protein BMS9Abin34_117 [Patescibacteria group bacterium]|nr:MAG: hypothetical protein BMS9Abin34_117 [Patescibacteria group bacterium]
MLGKVLRIVFWTLVVAMLLVPVAVLVLPVVAVIYYDLDPALLTLGPTPGSTVESNLCGLGFLIFMVILLIGCYAPRRYGV